jgi:hypothetical protein
MEVGVNPLGEIDEILDEPSHDAEKEKVIMVIFSTTTIDVFVVHPKDKQGTLTDYQKRVWTLSEEKTISENREELNKTFGKDFEKFIEYVITSEKLLTVGDVVRVKGLSYPTAKKRVIEYTKRREKVKKALKKLGQTFNLFNGL